MGGKVEGLSAAQVANNPFGDYAPQSTQIQGILKGMYDTFVADLEKGNADEAEAQKAFEELMMTKKREADTLQATLEQHNADSASKTKNLADSRAILDDTKAQLEADQAFFAETKAGCQSKAQDWAERTRLRTEELQGVAKAIEILSSPEAAKIFDSAHTTFLQVSSRSSGSETKERSAAFKKLQQLAVNYKNMGLAQIALSLKNGGHFDKVIQSIDGMIALLRQEEQMDIEHRDRCQGSENKNKNELQDLQTALDKATAEISRLEGEATRLSGEIADVETAIDTTVQALKDRLNMRNDEYAAFVQALKDDSDAVELLEKAVVAMKEFYSRNKIELSMLVKGAQEPTYTHDPDKAPETSWSGSNYGGRSQETGGVVAILQMVAEDLSNEMKVAREEDGNAQKAYESERKALEDLRDKQMATKLAKERELSDVNGKKLDLEDGKEATTQDHAAEEKLKDAIYQDCSWVASHFDSRRTKRKAEIDGLVEAKGYLAGVESGEVI